MSLHPHEQHPLVEQTDIQVTVVFYPLAGQEPPHPNPIVEVQHDDVVAGLLNDLTAIPVGIGEGIVAFKKSQQDEISLYKLMGIKSGHSPPPPMKTQTGNLDFSVAFAGAHKFTNRQSSSWPG